MSGTRTNSNSITAILINKLNNKKSGFRFAMLEKWELPSNTIFKDGTHSTINFPEMENKEVDIVGISGTEYVILIEIKANLSENIQESQKAGGQYVIRLHKQQVPACPVSAVFIFNIGSAQRLINKARPQPHQSENEVTASDSGSISFS